MGKKDSLKKAPIKLDLEKIELDVLSNSLMNGLHGGYISQFKNGLTECISGDTNCCTMGQTHCGYCVSEPGQSCWTVCACANST